MVCLGVNQLKTITQHLCTIILRGNGKLITEDDGVLGEMWNNLIGALHSERRDISKNIKIDME